MNCLFYCLPQHKNGMININLFVTAGITNEVTYAENMEKLGSVALSREAETGIGNFHNYFL